MIICNEKNIYRTKCKSQKEISIKFSADEKVLLLLNFFEVVQLDDLSKQIIQNDAFIPLISRFFPYKMKKRKPFDKHA